MLLAKIPHSKVFTKSQIFINTNGPAIQLFLEIDSANMVVDEANYVKVFRNMGDATVATNIYIKWSMVC